MSKTRGSESANAGGTDGDEGPPNGTSGAGSAHPRMPMRPRAYLGLVALGVVPTLLAAVVVVPVGLLGGAGSPVGTLPVLFAASAVVGIGVATVLGPILVDRRIDRLPDAELDDRPAAFIEDRVATVAGEVGIDPPDVTVVRGDAANVAVTDGYRGARVVVSTRLLSLPADDRDAALRHALVRIRSRDAAIVTASLPGLVAVETVALLATLLVGRRTERTEADRRVNRIHGYEPERERVPPIAYTVGGALLWLLILPVWIPAVVGDRLYVAERRRAADVAVSRVGHDERTGIANAVAFARDAAGAADWPPLFDRLSLVSMADPETDRIRGTSSQETRVRLARLRSKRAL